MRAKERQLIKTLMHLKPMKILLELRDGPKYASIIAKKIDCTYSHTVRLLDLCKDLGVVEFEKKGRIKIIRLTEYGNEVAKGVECLIAAINEGKKSQ